MKCLSDENRYRIIELLLNRDYCVRALAHQLGITESAVSQHLSILRSAHLIVGEKRGYFTHYAVDRKVLKDAAKLLSDLSDYEPQALGCHMSATNNHTCRNKERLFGGNGS
jgi:DNA-binding transcriptional ArsR family regulator